MSFERARGRESEARARIDRRQRIRRSFSLSTFLFSLPFSLLPFLPYIAPFRPTSHATYLPQLTCREFPLSSCFEFHDWRIISSYGTTSGPISEYVSNAGMMSFAPINAIHQHCKNNLSLFFSLFVDETELFDNPFVSSFDSGWITSLLDWWVTWPISQFVRLK